MVASNTQTTLDGYGRNIQNYNTSWWALWLIKAKISEVFGDVHGNSSKANWHVTLVMASASVNFRIDITADVYITSKE